MTMTSDQKDRRLVRVLARRHGIYAPARALVQADHCDESAEHAGAAQAADLRRAAARLRRAAGTLDETPRSAA